MLGSMQFLYRRGQNLIGTVAQFAARWVVSLRAAVYPVLVGRCGILEPGRVAALQGHTDAVNACAVTPDGRHVVSASRDETLKVWELASGRERATLQGHTDTVNACAATP